MFGPLDAMEGDAFATYLTAILARRAVKAFEKPAVPVRVWRLGALVSVGTSMIYFAGGSCVRR